MKPRFYEEKCCEHPNIVLNGGFHVCSNCGTAIDKVIKGFLKKKYLFEKNTKQTERKYLEFGPRTIISGTKDGNGYSLKPKSLAKFERLSKINRGLVSGLERNLWVALPQFNLIGEKLKAPSYVYKDAYRIYLYTAKKKMALGRSIKGLITAAFMAAFRMHNLPKTWEELKRASQDSRDNIMVCFKAIYYEVLPALNLKIKHINEKRFLEKFIKELKLSMKCRKKSTRLIQECKNKGMRTSGKDPKGYAAAAIYLCSKNSGEFKTQKQICKIAQISEVTLRNRIKELKKYVRDKKYE